MRFRCLAICLISWQTLSNFGHSQRHKYVTTFSNYAQAIRIVSLPSVNKNWIAGVSQADRASEKLV